MSKCKRCNIGGLFRRIDKVTGLCGQCAQELIKKHVLVDIKKKQGDEQKCYEENEPHLRKVVSKDNKPLNRDVIFDEFDDYDKLKAESAELDKIEKEARKKRFETESSSTVMKRKRIIMADRKSSVSIDDLVIEPEEYDYQDKLHISKIKQTNEETPENNNASTYNYPPIDLLSHGEEKDTFVYNNSYNQKAQLLVDTLQSFGITTKLTGISHGPRVTRFELRPAMGIRFNQIKALESEIMMALATEAIEFEFPIPGKSAIGICLPNDEVETVYLRDLLESSEASVQTSRIAVGLGKDSYGRYIMVDIAKMPHLLIAGQIGSGKSTCINAIISSILFRSSPEEVKLILIDTKVMKLSVYNDIPHLLCPVITDSKKAVNALDWAVSEMKKRYKLFAERNVRDLQGYNSSLKNDEKMMPSIIIIIDELKDLMKDVSDKVEDSICRLSQMSHICGIHLVIVTQRPSVDTITGSIKGNISARIAFSVPSQVDSRLIIDHGGAEKLLGNGDMLFVSDGMKRMRIQGAWVSDDEVYAIVQYIKKSGDVLYNTGLLRLLEKVRDHEFEDADIPKLIKAVDIAIDLGQVSISMLQRKMRIGYALAGKIIDEMTSRGIVSEAEDSKPRNILITREQANEMFEEWV